MKRWIVFMALLCALAGGVTAQENVVLRASFTQMPESLDPLYAPVYERHTRDIVENLFIGLTAYNPAIGDIEPALAESWEVSDDGITWTFHLRPDIPWVHYDTFTGEAESLRPVDAEDFVYALRRACHPETRAPYTSGLFIIAGCQYIYNADPLLVDGAFIERYLGVRAVDPSTLELSLAFPAAYLPSIAASPEMRPIPREIVSTDPTNWTAPANLYTSGPWLLTAWEPGERLELFRNPFWPEPASGNVTQVEIVFDGAGDSGVDAFLEGRIDLIRPADSTRLIRYAPDQIDEELRPTVILMGISQERPYMQDANLRRALAWAVNREAVAEAVRAETGALVAPITHMIPPGMVGSPPMGFGTGYDPEAARAALAATPHEGCWGFAESITIRIDKSPEALAAARALVRGWMDTLGCSDRLFYIEQVTIQQVLDAARGAFSMTNEDRAHMWLVSWTADYLDAQSWVGDTLHCRYGEFFTGAPCRAVDDLIDAAGINPNPNARRQQYEAVETLLFGREGLFPVIPLHVSAFAQGRQPWVSGPLRLGPLRFDRITIDVNLRREGAP
jgi:ABC-type oligopeptide transport system substrate-binding subunit